MKYLAFVVAVAALVPSRVYSQDQQFSDCRSLKLAGNFVGTDEALVNGLVCKVGKAKANSASQQSAGKAAEGSMALLGIIEPEILRSKEKVGASPVTTGPTPSATLGSAPSGSLPGGAPPPSSVATIPGKSLGEIARAYRKDAAARITSKPEEDDRERNKPSEEVKREATASNMRPAAATVVQPQPAGKTQASTVADSTAAKKEEVIAVAPATVISTPAQALRASKNEVIAVPQAQPNAVKQEASLATNGPGPLHEPAVKLKTNLPAVVVTSTSAPEVRPPTQTEVLGSAQRMSAKEQTAARVASSSVADAAEPKAERLLSVGVFAVSKPASANPEPQPEANVMEEDGPFKEGQLSTCSKNISLGSMDKEKLFLAIPDWALQWYEKNQKRFPGICFSDSIMHGAKNYLLVFYAAEPHVPGAKSLTKVSDLAETTPVSRIGSFTTSYGSTWHHTYEQTVTTTITSLSAEKAPHNQPLALVYATAYSEQGIPISHHWRAKPNKEISTKPRKGHDAAPPEFPGNAELLNRMVEDIAKP
jgi:hypothetical protein